MDFKQLDPTTAAEAHAANHRNFHRSLASASEAVCWFSKSLGGDGRLEEAMEMWYVANPDKDLRDKFELEPDTCPDPKCGPCYDENYWPD